MRRASVGVSLLAVIALAVAGCGDSKDSNAGSSGGGETSGGGGSGVCATNTSTGDLLAEICDAGTLIVSTDPKYPPQSSYNEKTGEYEGFDIDVATEIANRLGVDIAWETPAWDVITAGSWNGRWDMSVGSMTPTNDRQKVLDFSQPYYYTPAVVVVNEDNTSVTDLVDRPRRQRTSASAAPARTSSSSTRRSTSRASPSTSSSTTPRSTATTPTPRALNDLALGDGARLDAVITSLTTAQGFIDAGKPVKIVGDPVFYEPLGVAIDKSCQRRPGIVRRGGRRDRRRDARRRHAHRAVEEVVRRHGPDGPAVTMRPRSPSMSDSRTTARWHAPATGWERLALRRARGSRSGSRSPPSGWHLRRCSACSSGSASSTPSGCRTTSGFIFGGPEVHALLGARRHRARRRPGDDSARSVGSRRTPSPMASRASTSRSSGARR